MSDDGVYDNENKGNIHTFGVYAEFGYKSNYNYDSTAGSDKNTLMKIELRKGEAHNNDTVRTLELKLKQDSDEAFLNIYLEDTNTDVTNNLGILGLSPAGKP